MSKVLITGATGLVGSYLTRLLADRGYEVVQLSRNPTGEEAYPTFSWDLESQTIDDDALTGVSSIIHLAGASISEEKWTEERKRIILESRVSTAKLLRKACENREIKLKHFISASAIGWYPAEVSESVYDETAPASKGFLADVCQQWEQAADDMNAIAENVAKIRIGLVMSRYGGALKQIERPIKYYLGAGLGSGKQYVSWVHRYDAANIFHHVLEHSLSGVYNAVAPDYTNNEDFMRTVADIIDRPIFFPNIPKFVAKKIFGDYSELVLNGPKISSDKIQQTNFRFEFPTLSSALFKIYWNDRETKHYD